MLVLVLLVTFFVLGLVILKYNDESFWGMGIAVFGGTFLAAALLSLAVGRGGGYEDVARYHAFQKTLTTARANGDVTSAVERAAIQREVVAWNCKLAGARFWNNTVFDIWVVDEFAALPDLE